MISANLIFPAAPLATALRMPGAPVAVALRFPAPAAGVSITVPVTIVPEHERGFSDRFNSRFKHVS